MTDFVVLNGALQEGARPGRGGSVEDHWEQRQPSDTRGAQLLSSLFIYIPAEISFKPRITKLNFF